MLLVGTILERLGARIESYSCLLSYVFGTAFSFSVPGPKRRGESIESAYTPSGTVWSSSRGKQSVCDPILRGGLPRFSSRERAYSPVFAVLCVCASVEWQHWPGTEADRRDIRPE